jgi:hypothetical protein
MNKQSKTAFVVAISMFTLFLVVNMVKAEGLSTRLKGKILLQVEQNGEAWYLNPDDEKRYYLRRPTDAFNLMRELGLGISDNDFNSFNGYAPNRLSGKILLKVESNGEAYYINPTDLKMHYLSRPADAFRVMRELGLGITDENLGKITKYGDNPGWETHANNEYGYNFRYPSEWKVNDRSFTYQGQQSKNVSITSPQRHDLEGYESESVYFDLVLGGDNMQILEQGFAQLASDGKVPLTISQSTLENTEEYKIAQEIIKTIKK